MHFHHSLFYLLIINYYIYGIRNMGATNMLVEPVGLVGLDPNPKGTVLIGSGAERVRRRKRLLGKALLQARPRNAEKSYESANP